MTQSIESLNLDLATATSFLDFDYADFSDSELAWFAGGPQVIETFNLVNDSDIIAEIVL